MGGVTRAEGRWAAAFAVILSLGLALPYWAAYSAQGEEWRFSGFLFGVEDGNSYIADMRQGAEGAWLFRIPYTSEPQSGALIYLPFLLLGKLAGGAAMHEQLTALFHLARFAAAVAMLLAVYRFLACFTASVPLRRWGTLAVGFGGGFGWILLGTGAYPLEFSSPEAFGFLSLFGLPHLAAARACLLLALAWLVSGGSGSAAKRDGVKIGLALVLAWLFQPLAVVVAWAVAGAYLVLLFLRERIEPTAESAPLRDAAVRALTAAAVTVPLLVYSALAFALDPVLRQWAAQNTLPSPPVWQYLLSYGILLGPALAGAWLARKTYGRWMLPLGWLIVFPILVYLPLPVQRRLAEGFWTALVVLAVHFAERKLAGGARRAAFILGTALLLPAAVFFWGQSFLRAAAPAAPVFLPAAEVHALEWLDANAEPGAVVLSSYAAGNVVPAYTDLIAFIGHGPETLHREQKQALVDIVLDGTLPDGERIAALRESGAHYVLLGPGELEKTPAGIPGCGLVYRADGWDVWKVTEDRHAGVLSAGIQKGTVSNAWTPAKNTPG
ncbi:MAG: hypothetical protein JW929_00735 [Anaerolineales bacterium]|nr:hypothetical protein [Anaerolineales bacterium]